MIGLAAGLLLAVAAVAGLELLLRRWAPVPDPYEREKSTRIVNRYIASEHPRNFRATLIIDEDISGVDPRGEFTTNDHGFRGDDLAVPKPADEYRIFLLGDSVVECLFLDDSKALSRVIQESLNEGGTGRPRYRVYGAGRSHDKSDDHVALVTQRLVHLEPDLLVFCSAVNDLMSSLDGYDHLHYVEQQPARVPAGKLGRMLLTQFQIPRRVFYALTGVTPESAGEPNRPVLRSKNREKVALRRSAPLSQIDPAANVGAYQRNVRTLVGAARANGISILLMTQPATWQHDAADREIADAEWRLRRGDVTYRRDLMACEMDRLNESLRQLASELDVPLFDAARIMPRTRELFYDDVHLTIAGARRTGEELARAIRDRRS